MICPDKVRDLCLFGMMCPREPIVDDDGECANFINKTLGALDGARTKKPDPAEEVELRAERFAIVDEIFEGVDWRKGNTMLQGLETPEMPRPIQSQGKREKTRTGIVEGPIGPLWDKAPRLCRFLHWLCSDSPSALFYGCKLGRRTVFYKDCTLCPEYRGFKHPKRRRKKCR